MITEKQLEFKKYFSKSNRNYSVILNKTDNKIVGELIEISSYYQDNIFSVFNGEDTEIYSVIVDNQFKNLKDFVNTSTTEDENRTYINFLKFKDYLSFLNTHYNNQHFLKHE